MGKDARCNTRESWESSFSDTIGSSHGACLSFSGLLTAPNGDPKHTIHGPCLVHKHAVPPDFVLPVNFHNYTRLFLVYCILYTTMIALGSLIQPHNIAAFLLCLALLAIIFRHLTRPSSLPLPPGPFKDNFFLGNTIPTSLYGL